MTQLEQILIVDDVETNRLVLSGYLKRFGFTVHAASDGLEALKLISTHKYKLILSQI